MRAFWILIVLVCLRMAPTDTAAQDIGAIRDDQITRLQDYVLDAILPSGLVRDSLVLDPGGSNFHPATADAGGFALVALSAFDHLGTLADAEARVEDILTTYAGLKPGVAPDRSADGHFIHFLDVDTGLAAGGGWDASYSPISSALLVAGAQFAASHFSDSATITALADQLTQSVNFNAAILPNGRIYLDMTKQGGGGGNTVLPWNEYMLVESLALREANNDRAQSVKHLWLKPENLMQAVYDGHAMLTDGGYAPAFWVQQMHFLNGDFRHNDEFEQFLARHQLADQAYSSAALGEEFRYGLTAGVIPNGYHADRIGDHPFTVFSPEAVAAWGDLDTLVQFYGEQLPTSDPRYRYGLVRVSASEPNWVPFDAGLVDHLYLLFGLVESIAPSFFEDRVLPGLVEGDYNYDGVVTAADYVVWRNSFASTADLRADGNLNGMIDTGDYDVWRLNFGESSEGSLVGGVVTVPEPAAGVLVMLLIAYGMFVPSRRPPKFQSAANTERHEVSCRSCSPRI